MISRSRKTAVLVVFGIGSLLVTSTTFGQARSAPKAPASSAKSKAKAVASPKETTSIREVGPEEARQAALLPVDLHGFSLRSMDVVLNGGDATVTETVGMWDEFPGVRYLWSVAITDMATKTTRHIQYRKQMFAIADSGYLEPTFTDTIHLAPGYYRIAVPLYRVGPKTDLEKLKADDTYAQGFMVSKGLKYVTVTK